MKGADSCIIACKKGQCGVSSENIIMEYRGIDAPSYAGLFVVVDDHTKKIQMSGTDVEMLKNMMDIHGWKMGYRNVGAEGWHLEKGPEKTTIFRSLSEEFYRITGW